MQLGIFKSLPFHRERAIRVMMGQYFYCPGSEMVALDQEIAVGGGSGSKSAVGDNGSNIPLPATRSNGAKRTCSSPKRINGLRKSKTSAETFVGTSRANRSQSVSKSRKINFT